MKQVPFVRECCYCGMTLGLEWLDYNTLSTENLRQYSIHNKIVSHGICGPCFDKEMAEAEAEAEDTVNMSIVELEDFLKED